MEARWAHNPEDLFDSGVRNHLRIASRIFLRIIRRMAIIAKYLDPDRVTGTIRA